MTTERRGLNLFKKLKKENSKNNLISEVEETFCVSSVWFDWFKKQLFIVFV